MKQLRWQILVVLITLGIVAVLLLSQQAPSGGIPILPQPEQGGVFTEGLVGSLGRLNPLLDWNNDSDRAVDRLLFSGLVRFDEHGLPHADLGGRLGRHARWDSLQLHHSTECGLARRDGLSPATMCFSPSK